MTKFPDFFHFSLMKKVLSMARIDSPMNRYQGESVSKLYISKTEIQAAEEPIKAHTPKVVDEKTMGKSSLERYAPWKAIAMANFVTKFKIMSR